MTFLAKRTNNFEEGFAFLKILWSFLAKKILLSALKIFCVATFNVLAFCVYVCGLQTGRQALYPSNSRASPAQSRAEGALCRGLRPRVRRLRRTGLVKQPFRVTDLLGPAK